MNLAFIEERVDTLTVSPQHTAQDGLNQLGYEIRWFSHKDFEAGQVPITKDTLVVGYICTYLKALESLGYTPPSNIDYPEELESFLGRDIKRSTLGEARKDINWPIFVKPIKDHKIFAGRVFGRFRDLLTSSKLPNELEVWMSEPVCFLSEYRCFLLRGEVVGVQFYKGDCLIFPDPEVVKQIAAAWKTAPIACCFDVGITSTGKTRLVEVNDGHSMGDYGLKSLIYARMIEARWCQLTGSKPIP